MTIAATTLYMPVGLEDVDSFMLPGRQHLQLQPETDTAGKHHGFSMPIGQCITDAVQCMCSPSTTLPAGSGSLLSNATVAACRA